MSLTSTQKLLAYVNLRLEVIHLRHQLDEIRNLPTLSVRPNPYFGWRIGFARGDEKDQFYRATSVNEILSKPARQAGDEE